VPPRSPKYNVQGVSFIMPLERRLSRDISKDGGFLIDKAAIPREKIKGEIQYKVPDDMNRKPEVYIACWQKYSCCICSQTVDRLVLRIANLICKKLRIAT